MSVHPIIQNCYLSQFVFRGISHKIHYIGETNSYYYILSLANGCNVCFLVTAETNSSPLWVTKINIHIRFALICEAFQGIPRYISSTSLTDELHPHLAAFCDPNSANKGVPLLTHAAVYEGAITVHRVLAKLLVLKRCWLTGKRGKVRVHVKCFIVLWSFSADQTGNPAHSTCTGVDFGDSCESALSDPFLGL